MQDELTKELERIGCDDIDVPLSVIHRMIRLQDDEDADSIADRADYWHEYDIDYRHE